MEKLTTLGTESPESAAGRETERQDNISQRSWEQRENLVDKTIILYQQPSSLAFRFYGSVLWGSKVRVTLLHSGDKSGIQNIARHTVALQHQQQNEFNNGA